jgi:hypothetical protein
MDSVTPGSYNDNLNIDNISDVQAMRKAICAERPSYLAYSFLGIRRRLSQRNRIVMRAALKAMWNARVIVRT